MSTLAVAGLATASTPSTPSATYSGCLSTRLKVIYNVTVDATTPPTCARRDTLISWNQTGPQGSPGALGPAGPAGAAGPVGATGATGDTGLTGAIGPVGPVGPKGDAGATGAVGPTGPIGLTGLKGDAGATGPAGPAGLVGPAGLKGDTGNTGAQGPVGPAGPAGSGATQFGTNTQIAAAGHGETCTLGEVILSAGLVANGLPANGQLLSINQEQALFSLLGTTYGGNGITNFALPNLGSAAPNGLTYSICSVGVFPVRNN